MPTTHTSPTLDALLRHDPFVRRLARSLLTDADAADDLAQETWLAAIRRPPSHLSAPRGWLARVTRNLAVSRHRQQAARARADSNARPPAEVPRPDEVAAREEVRQRVFRCLLALDEPYRSTLLLRYYEDLPPRLVATRLGIPVETVRTRVKRGLARLRADLDDGTEADRRRRWAALAAWAGPGAASTAAPPLLVLAGLTSILLATVGSIYLHVRGETLQARPAEEAETRERGGAGARLVGRADESQPRGFAAIEKRSAEPIGQPESGTPLQARLDLREANGPAVEGAIVYAVPKSRPELGLLPGLPCWESDETGAVDLQLSDQEKWLVRVLAHGYETAELEAATLERGMTRPVMLRPAPSTRVVLRRANGRPLTTPVHLRLMSRVDRPTKSVGGLGDYVLRKDLSQSILVPVAGEAEVGLTVPLPASLTLDPGFPSAEALQPTEVLIDEYHPRIDLTLADSARIGLRLYEGETDRAPRLNTALTYLLTSEDTGAARPIRFSYATSTAQPNKLDLVSWTPIGPGRYTLTIRAAGWREWRHENIDLRRAGSRVDLVARLVPLPAEPPLVVVTLPDATRSATYLAQSACARQAGTVAGSWTPLGDLHLERTPSKADLIVRGLDEGTWDLLIWIWDGKERRVGLARGVEVAIGAPQRVTVETVRGLLVRLTPDAPHHERYERVVLEAPGIGTLPLREMPKGRFSGAYDDFQWSAPEPGTWLGPYPTDQIDVVATRWTGETVHQDVR